MAKNGYMTIDEKKMIVGMYHDGYTINKIATTIDRNFRTVEKFINKQIDLNFEEYKEFLETYKEKKKEEDINIVNELQHLKQGNIKVANLALGELERRLNDEEELKQIDIHALIKIAGIASDKVIKMMEVEKEDTTQTKIVIVDTLPDDE